MMQSHCQWCGWTHTIGCEALLYAVAKAQADKALHHIENCPKCHHTLEIDVSEMMRHIPSHAQLSNVTAPEQIAPTSQLSVHRPTTSALIPKIVWRDFHNKIRSLLLSKLPEVAIETILNRVSEFQQTRWKVATCYEFVGDISYLTGNIKSANEMWGKALELDSSRARYKVLYRSAQKPEDLDQNLIDGYSKWLIAIIILPFTKPEFYSTVLKEDDPHYIPSHLPQGSKRTDIQLLYANDLANAFKNEISDWQLTNGETFLDFVISQTKAVQKELHYGFPGTEYHAIEACYQPRYRGVNIWKQTDEWFRNAENKVRRLHNLPLRGAQVRETLLYEVVKQVLDGIKVVRQHEAWDYIPWLKPQHVDIFVPQLNLGIEYQGEQHFEPVQYFGGEEGFQKIRERDERKKELFQKYNVTLIYVMPDDEISPDTIRRLLEPFVRSSSVSE